jgi:hypothetical protein
MSGYRAAATQDTELGVGLGKSASYDHFWNYCAGSSRYRMVTQQLKEIVGHFWYKFLDNRFPQTTWKVIAIKVGLDQACFSPPFCILCNSKCCLHPKMPHFLP